MNAKDFCLKAHQGQVRRGWEEYSRHPMRVAAAVEAAGGSKEAVCAAYLHDTVEDCGTSLKEIEKGFGVRVMEIVDILSKKEGEKDHIERILKSEDRDALLIKEKDLMDNLSVREKDYWPGMEDALRRYEVNLRRVREVLALGG